MVNAGLSDPTFKQMRDFIYEKSGIFIPDAKKYLVESRLETVMKEKNMHTFEEYLSFIRLNNEDEIKRLFDAMTIKETYFFREPQQLDIFIKNIVQKVLEQKKTGAKKIKVWSAACSTGEEPYTLSIMLKENPSYQNIFEIYASDISRGALESAQRAVYNSYSVRNIPEPYIRKYFSNSGQTYTLSPAVKVPVKFMNVNLINEKDMKLLRGMDIIFCRNVLIYFDDKAKQKVVSYLYDNLNQGGFLFIGASESLHSVTRALRPTIMNNVVVYQKV
ncbi:MAG: protein-glutamate O-methyltransferase CheR [Nitrospirae bacterium]|nr:protein-glutamate O-methyltransferase CheR [Nitrospirota bacterium]